MGGGNSKDEVKANPNGQKKPDEAKGNPAGKAP
jgi:hypothetical protein